MDQERPQEPDATLNEAIAAIQSGEVPRARKLLSRLVLDHPESVDAWWWLAQTLEEPDKQAFCCRKILAIDPVHAGARERLGIPPEVPEAMEIPAAPSPGPQPTETPPAPARRPVRRGGLTSTQRLILVLLALGAFLIAAGGGAYVVLDSLGHLPALLSRSTLAPTLTATVTHTPTPVSLSAIPTWTPTPSYTPQPTSTPAATATPTTPSSPTPIPPTPAAMPDPADAQVALIMQGTGPLTLLPGDFPIFAFQPSEPLSLANVATLVFQAFPASIETPPTLEIYLYDPEEDFWRGFGAGWGDTPIPSPRGFVSSEGVILAALRNWGEDIVELSNATFSLAGFTTGGAEVQLGLNREIIRVPQPETSTPTPVSLD